MKIWIYRGVPGSGKTTHSKKQHPKAKRFSTDDFFMVNGEYRFDPSKLGEAHGKCLLDFVEFLISRTKSKFHQVADAEFPDVVVDNTNTSIAEVAPYAALALAYGHELQIVTLCCDPAVAWKRNTHSVPERTVMAMAERMDLDLPPWWPNWNWVEEEKPNSDLGLKAP